MNRRHLIFLVLVALAFAVGLGAGYFMPRTPFRESEQGNNPVAPGTLGARGRPERIPIVDVHVHLDAYGYDTLTWLMERYHFDHVVNLSGGHPLGNLDVQLAIARVAHNITVFTGMAYEQAENPGYGARMARALEIAHEKGARGLKISKHLGLGLKGPDGKLVAVDDPELDILFERAGQLKMPVAIHTGDPKAFWNPVDASNERFAELSAHPGWALHGKAVPTFDELLNQLERRIARHPHTTFISVHFGNCAEDPERVARMLRKYPNLYIDTAARIPEFGRHTTARMREFFVEFQDRVLYGSDLGVGDAKTPLFLGSSGAAPSTDADRDRFFSATYRYFETADQHFDHPTPIQGAWKISGVNLPREVLEKIYFRNAARLLDLPIVEHQP